jgi:hypothetical protein
MDEKYHSTPSSRITEPRDRCLQSTDQVLALQLDLASSQLDLGPDALRHISGNVGPFFEPRFQLDHAPFESFRLRDAS